MFFRPRSARLPLFGTSAFAALTALACASEVDPYAVGADTGSTHALINIERSAPASGSGLIRGSVLAGFARIAPALTSRPVMSLVGLAVELPALGQCRSTATDGMLGRSQLGYVEFLEAGDIRLQTNQGSSQLSARAFPTITDLISGVVYTTRDRSSDMLPAGARYAISATGNGLVPALMLNVQAPQALEGVLVGRTPLAEIDTLAVSDAVELAWSPGESADVVVVELTKADGAAGTICSFRDDVGSGTVPGDMIEVSGPGRLSMHRVRTREFAKAGIDRGELHFDFALRANLNFVR